MRSLFALFVSAAAAAEPSVEEIVERALRRDSENRRAARNYTFVEHAVQRNLGPDGKVRSTKSKTYDVTVLEREPYRRLVAIDGRPLTPKQEREEEERLHKSGHARRTETEEQRKARLANEQKKREFTKEIPLAFQLQLRGSEEISGRDCYVIEGVPRPGYKPRTRNARLFPHLKGRLWIDKADYSLVRGEAEVIDTLSIGLFLARIHKGTRATFEQSRVNNEVWLPARVQASAAARIGLVKKLSMEMEITYRDYRKFQADSRLIGSADPQP